MKKYYLEFLKIITVLLSVVITLEVIFTTLNHIVENAVQNNWNENVFPIVLISIMFITSVIHIVLRNVPKNSNLKLRLQPHANFAFIIQLLILMVYGLYLNITGEKSIINIICISANIMFLIVGIIAWISLIKNKNQE